MTATPLSEPWIAYIRVSTYYEDKISPDIQRSAITAWAQRNGRRITEWVEDLDVSGRKTKRKITHCIEQVEQRAARGVAVWRFSRFGRSRHANAVNLHRLESVGGRLESATEAADTTNAFGRLQLGMALKFAEFESDRIGEQWAETRDHRRELGLPSTGGQRWGYIWHRRRHEDETGIIHPEWYEPNDIGRTLTALHERAAEGESMSSLTQWLGRNGYLGTRGKPWLQSGLTRYMDSGFAAGWIRYHPHDCDCPPADPDRSASRAALCPRRIWIPGSQEPIVPEDVWEEYKRRRKLAREQPTSSRKAAYPHSGLARCGRCGGHASAGGSSTRGAGGVLVRKQGYVYRCSAHKDNGTCDGIYIRRSVVEQTTVDYLAEWADEIEAEAAQIPQQRQQPDDDPAVRLAAARDRLRGRLAEIAQQLDKQTDLVSRGIIPEDSYLRERDRLSGEQQKVTAELAELDKNAEEPRKDRADYVPVMRGLVDRWEITPVETRRGLLRTLLRGVWAYPPGTGPRPEEPEVYAVPVPIWEEEPAPIGPRAVAA